MAKVILHPIGGPLEKILDPSEAKRNAEHLGRLEAELEDKRSEVRAGWGPKYVDRVHAKGKLTTWERIENLKDEGTEIFPVGTLVNYGLTFGSDKRTSPGAGVVTAFVRVQGRLTMVIANDNTVASGSWWPKTPEKIERAQEMALRLRIPVIYLIDCSGLYLPEQGHTFPGKTGAGAIFKMNSKLSASGTPQIAGVFGDCIAGGGYMPIISDVVYMTEQAYMVIAGAALVKGGKSQKITSLDIGGPNVHVHVSNCADYRVPDDEACLRMIRLELARLPTSAGPYYRRGVEPAPPGRPASELSSLLPVDHRQAYDIHQVLARIVDDGLFREVTPNVGLEMICGVGRIGGLWAGIIANNPDLTDHPILQREKRPGSLLYREGIAKISQFSRCCNDDGVPIIWLHDISGFDIGVEAEKHGLLGYGSSLIYTNSTNTVPMFTVLLRKASGAGYYAMAGMPYNPVVQLATTISRLGVMEGRTLAIGTFNTKLDDDFEIVAETEEEREKIRRGMEDVEARITADMDPVKAARQMDLDEVVRFDEIRTYLEVLVEAAYQGYGYRRVKNPQDLVAPRHGDTGRRGKMSRDLILEVIVEGGDADRGELLLKSPTVGMYGDAPKVGEVLVGRSRAGRLTSLGKTASLVMPPAAAGRVAERMLHNRRDPVDYGQVLLRLVSVEATEVDEHPLEDTQANVSGVPKGSYGVTSPTHGMFYRRPRPDAPLYVDVGHTVEEGTTLALVEVMKCFSAITYGGEGLPPRAKVIEVRAEDSSEIQADQILFVVEKA